MQGIESAVGMPVHPYQPPFRTISSPRIFVSRSIHGRFEAQSTLAHAPLLYHRGGSTAAARRERDGASITSTGRRTATTGAHKPTAHGDPSLNHGEDSRENAVLLGSRPT